MTTINILIYTDSKDFSPISGDGDLRVSKLKELLEMKRQGFAEFKLEVINRYENFVQPQIPEKPKTIQKLTSELLNRFDEVWFFGWYQSNVDQEFEETYGGRENELDDKEVEQLTKWMTCGGVLMTGDHSLHAPGGKDTDPRDTFLCLGRALGHRVPRAGRLRKWEGPPTINADDSFNTLVRTGVSSDLQADAVPQTLRLTRSHPNSPPHPIFLGERRTIDVFPDHGHEGKLIPPELDCNWPPFDEKDASKKPGPEFVASGCDKRSCQSSPVLAVYDGDNLGVGRIVADSSWHHYVNVNLSGFTDVSQDSTLDLLAQFFHNLALYLAPRSKREQMSRDLIAWLVQHPAVKEERGNDPVIVGKIALHNLSQITTGFEIEELFHLAVAGQMTADRQRATFSSVASERSLIPSLELVMGSIINRYYRAASDRLSPDVAKTAAISKDEDIIAAGLEDAFSSQGEWLAKALSEVPQLRLATLDQGT